MSRIGSTEKLLPVALAVAAIAVLAVCGWRVASALRADTSAQDLASTAAPATANGPTNADTSRPRGSAFVNRTAVRANQPADVNGGAVSPRRLSLAAPPRIDPSRALQRLADRRAERVAAGQPQPIVPEADARVALDYVGADAIAEQIWELAINDPAMPPEARSNLIEDLNENGFRDPDHIQPDELPLVMSRIDLIEQLAPQAMDPTNAAAFEEAYKDLTNIANRLQPQVTADAGQLPQ